MRIFALAPFLSALVTCFFGIAAFSCKSSKSSDQPIPASQDETVSTPITEKPTQSNPDAPIGYRSLPTDFLGQNLNAMLWEGGFFKNTSAHSAVKDMGVKLIRYPGGTESDYYDWSTGKPVADCAFRAEGNGGCRTWDSIILPALKYRNVSGINTQTFSEGTLNNLKELTEKTGSKPLFVLNMFTASLETNRTWLLQAAALGLAIEYIEVGNEHYFSDLDNDSATIGNEQTIFESGKAYGDRAKVWIESLRTSFPLAKFAITGIVPDFILSDSSYFMPTDSEYLTRVQEWNTGIKDSGVLEVAHAVSLHSYHRPVGDLIGNSFSQATVENILSHPDDYLNLYVQRPEFTVLPTEKDLWLTEYNIIGSQTSGFVQYWTHGLYMGLYNIKLLENDRFKVAINHVLMGNPTWQSIFHPGNSFGVNPVPGSTPFHLTASGRSHRFLSLAMDGMSFGKLLSLADVGVKSINDKTTKFYLMKSKDEKKSKLFYINGHNVDITVQLNQIEGLSGSLSGEAASVSTRILSDANVTPFSLQFSGSVSIPAYSMGYIH